LVELARAPHSRALAGPETARRFRASGVPVGASRALVAQAQALFRQASRRSAFW
jgi:hypothetical protein